VADVFDPYRLLGLPRNASLRQIKAAHRALAKRYHPDAPTADPSRFLRVQEAYQVLADPLRRREWDDRHAPAPMRADEPSRPGARAREGRRAQSPPGTGGRSYTWSAGDVPWWEEGGRRSARSGRARAPGPDAAGAPPTDQAEPVRADFDVYNRSSGAAWSAAARAYFRRADEDLPRRGSFQYQGSQPLTAARARAAAQAQAQAEARRGAAEPARTEASGSARPAAAGAGHRASPNRGAASTGTTASATGTAAAGSAAAPGRASTVKAPPRTRPAPAPGVERPEAGVARDAGTIARVRQRVRAEERAARWPTRFQRVRYALLAWLPLALLIGYGGPAAAGCAPGADDCPALLVPGQAVSAAVLLGVLLLLPRVAYAAAVATSLLVIVLGPLAVAAGWLFGVRAPQLAELPPWALLVAAIVLLLVYALIGAWLMADRSRRPWAVARVRR
jgi:curved DNA-binding protein CbpA